MLKEFCRYLGFSQMLARNVSRIGPDAGTRDKPAFYFFVLTEAS